jgi:large subunit ribosomal protein L1
MQIRFKTPKNGPIVRNRLRLPHPVKTDTKIAVICSPDSKYYELSKAAGAWIVGEDDLFDRIREGKIDFDRCLCQTGSFEKLNKAGLGRILGPKGLMPTSRVGTVIMDPVAAIRDMTGGAEYRERLGVIQMAIGQLGFTPEELARNIKAAMESIKKDMNMLSEKVHKELAEVVLSSTNAPGFPLSGEMEGSETGITTKDLSTSA